MNVGQFGRALLGRIRLLGKNTTYNPGTPSIGQRNRVVRLGDMSAGHIPFPARQNIEASTDVFVNNKGAHRLKDRWLIHCNPLGVCHEGFLSAGCGSVFVNNRPIGRVGDPISCGDVAATGSPNVFVGSGSGVPGGPQTWGSITTTWKTETHDWKTI